MKKVLCTTIATVAIIALGSSFGYADQSNQTPSFDAGQGSGSSIGSGSTGSGNAGGGSTGSGHNGGGSTGSGHNGGGHNGGGSTGNTAH